MISLFSNSCRIIAEIAQAHDGSLGTAHALIDAASASGAWAVKFQAHLASAESTREEPWRIPFSKQDTSRYAYWKRMEFSPEQWAGLRAHARDCGLEFIVSPFSNEAIDLLAPLAVSAWKIASGETSHFCLLDKIFTLPEPVLISTGMSGWEEIGTVAARAREKSREFALFQCDTQYPSPPETWGLNVLQEMADRFSCPVGLSDHSGTIYAGLAAAATGAQFIEVHLTLSHQAFGPDVSSSLDPVQIASLVRGARQIATARRHPVDKNSRAEALQEVRAKFTRSVALKRRLPAGTVLSQADLSLKKPSGGFGEADLAKLIGRKLACDVEPDVLLRPSHLISP